MAKHCTVSIRMVKRILIVLILNCTVVLYAQDENVFAESEKQAQTENTKSESVSDIEPSEERNSPGNPGGPVSIDEYLPLLFLIASGIAVFPLYKKRFSKVK